MQAWIGLGSNLNEPPAQLQRAVEALSRLADSRVLAVSTIYRNPPLVLPGQSPDTQPDYYNAVALLDTALSPLALLDALQAIEQAQHRVRAQRWDARTLDLDILLYGDARIDEPRLTVPHPGLRVRRFALLPLHDLAPGLVLPDGDRISDLLATCPPSELVASGTLRIPPA